MKNIDEYIAMQSIEVRPLLEEIRSIINAIAPDATEVISYAMPTFKRNKNLVHFAAFKSHIGFYPGPGAIENFIERFSHLKHSKGAIQFPLDQPIPKQLIEEITLFRLQEDRKLDK